MKMTKPEYPPAPEGVYTVEISKVVEMVNPFSGKPQYRVVFKVVDKKGISPLVDWINPVLDPRSKLIKLCNALGLKIDNLADEIFLEEYVGRQVSVRVERKFKKGRAFANIAEYMRPRTDDL